MTDGRRMKSKAWYSRAMLMHKPRAIDFTGGPSVIHPATGRQWTQGDLGHD
jgi:hypothetical protein